MYRKSLSSQLTAFFRQRGVRMGVRLLSAIAVLGTTVVLFWLVPEWQIAPWRSLLDPKDMLALENSVRSTIAQLLGGAFLLSGLYFTWQNVLVAREGKITDRFSKAIEHLADKDRITVRLGGIYALERIARDSRRDHLTVMEVLTAFVRENARYDADRDREEREKARPDDLLGLKRHKAERERKPAADIQAVITVLGRRQWRETEAGRLNLTQADLRGGTLSGHFEHALLQQANLDRARLFGSHLAEAVLMDAILRDAFLVNVDLTKATLLQANLQSATFQDCNLEGASLVGADLQQAVFHGKNRLAGAELQGANLRAVTGLSVEALTGVAYDEKTQFPEGLKPPGPSAPARAAG
jgi:hypothetical protein